MDRSDLVLQGDGVKKEEITQIEGVFKRLDPSSDEMKKESEIKRERE